MAGFGLLRPFLSCEFVNKKDNSLGHLTLELSAFGKNVLTEYVNLDQAI